MQAGVAELEFEGLVHASRPGNKRVGALDFAEVDRLLQFFALNLEHERNPALPRLETIEHILKEWLRQGPALGVDHERVDQDVDEARDQREEERELALLDEGLARNVSLADEQLQDDHG